MRLLVTGACGYKGSVLVPKLLETGHEVVAYDIQWFGQFLPEHENLMVVQGDVRFLIPAYSTVSTLSFIWPLSQMIHVGILIQS